MAARVPGLLPQLRVAVQFDLPAVSPLDEAIINFAAIGNNTVVAAIAGQTIRIFRLFFVVSIATNLIIRDGAVTDLTGLMAFTANGSMTLDLSNAPWFVTTAGNAFVINQSAAATVAGRCYFTQGA